MPPRNRRWPTTLHLLHVITYTSPGFSSSSVRRTRLTGSFGAFPFGALGFGLALRRHSRMGFKVKRIVDCFAGDSRLILFSGDSDL